MSEVKEKRIYILDIINNHTEKDQRIFSSLDIVEKYLSNCLSEHELFNSLLLMVKNSIKNKYIINVRLICSSGDGDRYKVYLYDTHMDTIE